MKENFKKQQVKLTLLIITYERFTLEMWKHDLHEGGKVQYWRTLNVLN